jgi:hypothetical protein
LAGGGAGACRQEPDNCSADEERAQGSWYSHCRYCRQAAPAKRRIEELDETAKRRIEELDETLKR